MSVEDRPVDAAAGTDRIPGTRRILGIVGVLSAGSLGALVLSILRSKFVALEVGAVGVGLIAVVLAILAPFNTVFGLGLSSSGPKRLGAIAASTPDRFRSIGRALVMTSIVSGAIGSVLVFLLAPLLAVRVIGDPQLTTTLRIASCVVLLTVVAAVPAAYWGGTGQFRRLAASQPVMSLVLTMVIVVALLADLDVIVAVVVLPAVVNVLGLAYLGRGIPWRGPGVASSLVHEERRALVRLGVAFVLTAMIAVLGQTALRLLVDAHFGRGATGQFQAAFSVAVVQITLILQTLASEYLPRLSGCIGDREAMNGAVQQQVRLTLLLVSPIAIIGIALPELALRLFYSSEFTGAASLMQLLLLGTLFRVVYWVLAFIWVVHERRRVLVAQELAVNALLIATFGVLLTFVGLEAAGIAYLSAHLIVAMATLIQARRFSGFSLGQGDGALLVFLVSASCLLYWLTSTNAPAAVPVALAVAVCAVCGAMLLRMIGLGSLRRYLRSSH